MEAEGICHREQWCVGLFRQRSPCGTDPIPTVFADSVPRRLRCFVRDIVTPITCQLKRLAKIERLVETSSV